MLLRWGSGTNFYDIVSTGPDRDSSRGGGRGNRTEGPKVKKSRSTTLHQAPSMLNTRPSLPLFSFFSMTWLAVSTAELTAELLNDV
jgi:hypothetical protein